MKWGSDNRRLAEEDACANAQYPFACYLDKAMAAGDPSLCRNAGFGKVGDCLRAYSEILEIDVKCSEFQDPTFEVECLKAFQRIKTQPTRLEAASTTPSLAPDTADKP